VWLTELQISYYKLRNWEKMASNSKDGEDEQEWEDRLIWYPNASSGEGWSFTQGQRDLFFKKWKCAWKASEELVRNIYYFKTPLANAVATAVFGAEAATHRYIIVGTNMNRFFCFSKGATNISVLCAYDIEDLHDIQHQGPGAECVYRSFRLGIEDRDPLDISDNNHTIADIVQWIFQSGEITKGYHTVLQNCAHFASRLYSKFAAPYDIHPPCPPVDFWDHAMW